jgi:hypothetical protein
MSYRMDLTTAPAANGACPHGDPTCLDGFPCLACCDDLMGPATRTRIATSEVVGAHRHGAGCGGSTAARTDGATDKQLALIARLDPTADTSGLTKKAASALIDGLMAKAKAAPVEGYRWTKLGDEWLAIGEAVADGSTITITKAGERNGAALLRVRKAEAKATASGPASEVPSGHYAIESNGQNDLLFVRVDNITEGKWAGRTFVKMIVGGHPDAPIRGAAALSVLKRITEAGVEDARTLYGQQIGRCWMCNRTLTDEASRQAGIGPDCATRA